MDYAAFEPLIGADWGNRLRGFIESPLCDEIYAYLKKKSSEGRVICPSFDDTWRAFKETPYEELRVILVMQDPYPWKKDGRYVADGMALSCGNTGVPQPSLDLFYDGLQNDLPEYGSKDFIRKADLSYLCNQGVMMLNSSLTVELNKPNSHSNLRIGDKKTRLWEPFMKWFFEEVIGTSQGLVIVFAGKESAYYERFIYPHQHYILKCEHPASAAHQERAWDTISIFKTIDRILWENNKFKINWMSKRKRYEQTENGSARRA